ncbi:uncharacterized protein G2W53_039876 [Senna tora]|uniref:Uncharacterized protein n=1 Tax=Senna tora TaxID=362788 RepID=A0A834SNJ6_9FABA|nr:uncharacterized protein G2W53_039876 [Senna tora]
MYKHIPDEKSQSDLRNVHELRGKSLVTQVTETRRFALYLRNRVDLILELGSSWHGRRVDHVLTYSRREIAVGSPKRSGITRQKPCCANRKSRSDLRYVHELRGKILVAQVNETHRFVLYLRNRVDLILELDSSWLGRSVDHVLTYSNGFDSRIGVVMEREEPGSCLNILRT